MKVVLFCGGLGMRLRELSEGLPKPMVQIGHRPILWHVMKYYAHFGHRDFILCLGYKADAIRKFFLDRELSHSSGAARSPHGRRLSGDPRETDSWRITFVDTGLDSNVGMRLRAVRPYLDGEEMFLANYADGLTDLNLSEMIATFRRSDRVGCCLCTRPSQSFHVLRLGNDNLVRDIQGFAQTDVVVNGGYFIFRPQIFDDLHEGEDLVAEPLRRLIRRGQLLGYPHERFWCLDTFKEHCQLTELYESGRAPWEVWRADERRAVAAGAR